MPVRYTERKQESTSFHSIYWTNLLIQYVLSGIMDDEEQLGTR